MYGRMIHGKDASGNFYEAAQSYDVFGRVSLVLYALSILTTDPGLGHICNRSWRLEQTPPRRIGGFGECKDLL